MWDPKSIIRRISTPREVIIGLDSIATRSSAANQTSTADTEFFVRKVESMERIEHRPAHLGNVALDQRPELRVDLRAVVQLVG